MSELSPPKRGICLVLSAPSGAGKSTITKMLHKNDPSLGTSISATTRQPRGEEKDGVHYHFKSKEEFQELIKNNGLVEWAEVFENYYGTPREPIEEALSKGQDIVLDVDWQGFRLMKEACPKDTVGIFILPPSLEELEKRLRGRGSDSDEVIKKRMNQAESEISHWNEFDYVITNDNLDKACLQVQKILESERLSTKRFSEKRAPF